MDHKKLENHAHMVALYALWYNFVRIHKTLRVTPAMAAGIESRLWSMEDVVKMVDAHHRPKPTFTVQMRKDGGYGVNMDPNAYAPVLHIDGFATEEEAQAWIRNESEAWFAKLAAARM